MEMLVLERHKAATASVPKAVSDPTGFHLRQLTKTVKNLHLQINGKLFHPYPKKSSYFKHPKLRFKLLRSFLKYLDLLEVLRIRVYLHTISLHQDYQH